MENVRLSICIPVYNFGEFIGDTLESIIQQATDEVEIIVVDGGSTDNTQHVVLSCKDKFPRINYLRLDKRGGIDKDMSKTVELARGEYCWLFGGDDIMVPGSIMKILGEIKSGQDVYLCEDTLCTFDMRPIRKHGILNTEKEIIFELSNDQDRVDFFEKANTPAAFFGFCSVLIFKKSRWDECEVYKLFNGTFWAHATRFFEMSKNGLTVKYIPQPLLNKRSDNDSFSSGGLVSRLEISIGGYNKIANYFYGADSIEAYHIRRALRSEVSFRHIMNIKLKVAAENNNTDMELLNRLVNKHYCDSSILNFAYQKIYQLLPLGVYAVIKALRARMKN